MNEEGVRKLGRRVYMAGVIACIALVAIAGVHFLFNPFRSETGSDVLMILAALPWSLFTYGFYVSAAYIWRRRFRTRALVVGAILHVAGLLAGAVVLWLVEVLDRGCR
jgi:hypothetical protein